MPTSSTTVTDQPVGTEVATQTVVEDGINKHIQRLQLDSRLNIPAKRYMVSIGGAAGIAGTATAGTNIAGLRKLAASPDVLIRGLELIEYTGTAGSAVPVQMRRATLVTGGTLILAANLSKMDPAAAAATLEVRSGAVTGTKAAEALHTFVPGGTGAALQGMYSSTYMADDLGGCFRLTGDDGLIFDTPIAANAANRYWINVSWEEL